MEAATVVIQNHQAGVHEGRMWNLIAAIKQEFDPRPESQRLRVIPDRKRAAGSR